MIVPNDPITTDDLNALEHARRNRDALIDVCRRIGRERQLDEFLSLTIGSAVFFARTDSIPARAGVGVVYECYRSGDVGAVSVIHENGFYDGWPLSHWLLFDGLKLCDCPLDYTFENVQQLMEAHRRGVFESAFQFGSEKLVTLCG